VLSALGGSIAVCLINDPFQPVVGGSGALFGMFGAIVALQMRQLRSALGCFDYEGPRQILMLIAINLAIGFFLPFISNTAHVGGLITGFAVTFLFMTPADKLERWMLAWRVATAALIAGLLMHCLQPTTRWDWLWRQARIANDANRQQELQHAATMSYVGTTDVSRFAQDRLEAQMDSYDNELRQLLKK